MSARLPPERRQELAARLRSARLRVTTPRLIILDALLRVGGHRSVEDVLRHLQREGIRLPRATVYNVIRSLVSSGLVMVADVGPGRMLVESAERWHHHFVCRECGSVIDVPCAVGAKPCLEPDLPGAEVEEAQIIWRGVCPRCVAARAEGGLDARDQETLSRPTGGSI
ncbi:MAG: transcriptional repressor [Thermomicrobium sp.]|nr:transcriptional repressor [Thermomicrobium sp.]